MRSPLTIATATVAGGIVIGLIAEALALNGVLWILALLAGMLAISLVDPVRFWATDEFPPESRLGSLLLRTPRQQR